MKKKGLEFSLIGGAIIFVVILVIVFLSWDMLKDKGISALKFMQQLFRK